MSTQYLVEYWGSNRAEKELHGVLEATRVLETYIHGVFRARNHRNVVEITVLSQQKNSFPDWATGTVGVHPRTNQRRSEQTEVEGEIPMTLRQSRRIAESHAVAWHNMSIWQLERGHTDLVEGIFDDCHLELHLGFIFSRTVTHGLQGRSSWWTLMVVELRWRNYWNAWN